MLARHITSREQNFLCRAGLAKDPAKILFVGDDEAVSYGDFQNWIGRYAAVLSKKYSVKESRKYYSVLVRKGTACCVEQERP